MERECRHPLIGSIVTNRHGHLFFVMGVHLTWRPDLETWEPMVELLESFTNDSRLARTTWPNGPWHHAMVGVPFEGFMDDFQPAKVEIL